MDTCYCNECNSVKEVVNSAIYNDGTLKLTLDCGHDRKFKMETK